jgi:GTP-binding protein
VSKTPGRTQLINLFETPGGGTLVDLPGYGYAAVPGKIKRGWEKMIVGYLQEREELEMIFVLVDGLIGPTDLDLMMLEQLRDSNVAFTVVATKQDKVKPSKSATRRIELATACQIDAAEIIWTSVSSGLGIDQLRTLVNRCLNTNPNRR